MIMAAVDHSDPVHEQNLSIDDFRVWSTNALKIYLRYETRGTMDLLMN